VGVSDYYASLYTRTAMLEFGRHRKSMSVLVQSNMTGEHELLVKGAYENVLARCSHVVDGNEKVTKLTAAAKQQISDAVEDYTSQGLRCLALATTTDVDPNGAYDDIDDYEAIESELTFVGVVCMMDPPRAEVNESIVKCRTAGIRVIVITGDNKVTAESICRRIGVFEDDEDVEGKSFTGADLESMTADEKNEAVQDASLFSRVEPRHKMELVSLLKAQGEVVAMTGDGVNDAPALRKADIGVAMGSGTDVAIEASDMVLQDDNFATIVMAVEEGRSIYANTKQFIRYLISSNIGEVACIFFTAMIGMPEALIPVQLLWVNLVTDGLPATALGFNPPDKDIMVRLPRGAGDGIINGWMFFRYMAIGLYVGFATVFGYIYWFVYAQSGPQITYEQLTHFHGCAAQEGIYSGVDCSIFSDARPSTISLSILVIIEMLNAFNALSENQSLLVVTVFSNLWVVAACILSFALHLVVVYVPWFAGIFHLAPINEEEWKIVMYLSVPVILLDEVLKFVSRIVSARELAARQLEKKQN
jgi:Ca2+ transporting ATPase